MHRIRLEIQKLHVTNDEYEQRRISAEKCARDALDDIGVQDIDKIIIDARSREITSMQKLADIFRANQALKGIKTQIETIQTIQELELKKMSDIEEEYSAPVKNNDTTYTHRERERERERQ